MLALVRPEIHDERVRTAFRWFVRTDPVPEPPPVAFVHEMFDSSEPELRLWGLELAYFLGVQGAGLAARIAELARRTRPQAHLRGGDVSTLLPQAICLSGRPEFAATAWIELEREQGAGYVFVERWGAALLATAGDEGARYLLGRMRDRRWSTLVIARLPAYVSGQGMTRGEILSHIFREYLERSRSGTTNFEDSSLLGKGHHTSGREQQNVYRREMGQAAVEVMELHQTTTFYGKATFKSGVRYLHQLFEIDLRGAPRNPTRLEAEEWLRSAPIIITPAEEGMGSGL